MGPQFDTGDEGGKIPGRIGPDGLPHGREAIPTEVVFSARLNLGPPKTVSSTFTTTTNGLGVDPSNDSRIFLHQPKQETKVRLLLVKRPVLVHKGRLWCTRAVSV